MTHCVRKTAPLALALLLALVAAASAGDNAGATFSLTSAATVSGVVDGSTVEVAIAADGLVGIKQLDVTIEVSPADAFDLTGVTMTLGTEMAPGVWFPLAGQLVDGTTNQVRVGAASFGASVTGATSFTVNVPASGTPVDASVSVALISVGPSSSDRDEFADTGIAVSVNPPVAEPTLTATGDTDASLEFSAVGTGDAADGSDGEVTFAVAFTDADGAAASGQAISWAVTNDGGEDVYVLAPSAATVASGETVTVSGTTASGAASLTLDSEGGKLAASTSASVTASTSADNSEGESMALAVDFSATWDVPVPAELASFAGQITADDDILLTWGVASQTNNLGWEVFRSVDNVVFEKASGLIAGDGTTDAFRTFEFVDAEAPEAEVVYYYLRQIDLDGSASRTNIIQISFAPTAVQQGVLPTATALAQNYPNPFNPETTIQFDLSEGAAVTLTVYDATGQVVRTLMEGEFRSAGSYSYVWDGRNAAGHRVSSGVYMYELRTGDFRSMRKMTLVQ
jgi:hypothetical protein